LQAGIWPGWLWRTACVISNDYPGLISALTKFSCDVDHNARNSSENELQILDRAEQFWQTIEQLIKRFLNYQFKKFHGAIPQQWRPYRRGL
jgi:hypothetical protein